MLDKTQLIAGLLAGVEGWCTPHKAQWLYDLAASDACKVAVEIGIFGGKSLLPMAAAFRDKGEGVIYGVEPWENSVAVETSTNALNDEWWTNVDMVYVKRTFLAKLAEHGIEKYARIIELPSDAALAAFQTPRFHQKIDLIHIDGSHSIEAANFDVTFWTRTLRPGSHLVLDDIEWPSVQHAYSFLKATQTEIHQSYNDDDGHFAVFKIGSV